MSIHSSTGLYCHPVMVQVSVALPICENNVLHSAKFLQNFEQKASTGQGSRRCTAHWGMHCGLPCWLDPGVRLAGEMSGVPPVRGHYCLLHRSSYEGVTQAASQRLLEWFKSTGKQTWTGKELRGRKRARGAFRAETCWGGLQGSNPCTA